MNAAALQILSVLCSHVALALKMIRLSSRAREAALNEERNRMAGEIHDSLAQSFAGIAMQLESAEDAALHEEHVCVFNALRRAREVARFGLAEARRSVLALQPSDALANGLAAALRSLAAGTCAGRAGSDLPRHLRGGGLPVTHDQARGVRGRRRRAGRHLRA